MNKATDHQEKTLSAKRLYKTAWLSIPLVTICIGLPAWSQTSAGSQLADLEKATQVEADAQKGRIFFSSTHANEWSCATCHGMPPTKDGEHASTGKRIAPLAPAFNPDAFTDQRRSDKWFKRNCKDVLERPCTDEEKADVLAYLLSLKP